MRDTRPVNAAESRFSKQPGIHNTSAVPQTDHLMPNHITEVTLQNIAQTKH